MGVQDNRVAPSSSQPLDRENTVRRATTDLFNKAAKKELRPGHIAGATDLFYSHPVFGVEIYRAGTLVLGVIWLLAFGLDLWAALDKTQQRFYSIRFWVVQGLAIFNGVDSVLRAIVKTSLYAWLSKKIYDVKAADEHLLPSGVVRWQSTLFFTPLLVLTFILRFMRFWTVAAVISGILAVFSLIYGCVGFCPVAMMYGYLSKYKWLSLGSEAKEQIESFGQGELLRYTSLGPNVPVAEHAISIRPTTTTTPDGVRNKGTLTTTITEIEI